MKGSVGGDRIGGLRGVEEEEGDGDGDGEVDVEEGMGRGGRDAMGVEEEGEGDGMEGCIRLPYEVMGWPAEVMGLLLDTTQSFANLVLDRWQLKKTWRF